MHIREAQPQDANNLTRLLDQLGYGGSGAFIQNRIQLLTQHPDAGILVCEVEEQVVGFLAYQFFVQFGLMGEFCRISYFCVDQHFRGRGIGESLEDEMEKRARSRKCDRIEVHCGGDRFRAHTFYTKTGYTESPKYFIKQLKTDP
jgi:GNAT superfamily N-acetyltransferase